ncbi:WYL domain-containing protein [Dubosiella newyorkensis]|uniref:WYL domain-containing protein n=1 Tax=Dubosiella newyorkensis TaxID=1862672 RepID=UPI0034E3838F
MFHIAIKHHAATIRYSSAHSENIRTIIPIGLYAMNGLWYCPAYCMAANQIREFRVDRKSIVRLHVANLVCQLSKRGAKYLYDRSGRTCTQNVF